MTIPIPSMGPGVFRLVLALAVFASHISYYDIGRPAVFLFFMLSGYWVVRLFVESRLPVWLFEVSRLLRVWPMFALATVTMMALRGWFDDRLWSNLALIGLASRNDLIIYVAWSLDIELQFYAVLPFAAWLLTVTRATVVGGAIMVAVVTAIGGALLSNGLVTVAGYAPMFAAGAAIYSFRWSPSRRLVTASVVAFVVVGLVFVIAPPLRTLLMRGEHQWWRDFVHMAWCLTLVPFVAANVHQASSLLDRHVGNLSFPLYLFHPLAIVVADSMPLPGLAQKAVALALAIAVSLLLYIGFDRPLDRLRKRADRRSGRDAPAIGAPVSTGAMGERVF